MNDADSAGADPGDACHPLRPIRMRIDPILCRHDEVCRALAPEVRDGSSVPVTPNTLAAMAACPTGALRWAEADDQPDPA